MQKIDRNLKILIGIAIILVIGIEIFVIKNQAEIDKLTSASVSRLAPVERNTFLIIDNGTEEPQTFKMEVGEKTTVFDLLKQTEIALDYTEYDIGIFIKAIGDKENGQNGKYWLYYVNGEMPQVAVDKNKVNPGDKVEFRFEKSPY